ncbi:unnamed protein product [Closterium sp. NIES-64]|nr:unnamed protein product [Closterium sp. NIES-64]
MVSHGFPSRRFPPSSSVNLIPSVSCSFRAAGGAMCSFRAAGGAMCAFRAAGGAMCAFRAAGGAMCAFRAAGGAMCAFRAAGGAMCAFRAAGGAMCSFRAAGGAMCAFRAAGGEMCLFRAAGGAMCLFRAAGGAICSFRAAGGAMCSFRAAGGAMCTFRAAGGAMCAFRAAGGAMCSFRAACGAMCAFRAAGAACCFFPDSRPFLPLYEERMTVAPPPASQPITDGHVAGQVGNGAARREARALISAPLRSPLLPCAHLCSPLLPCLTSAPLRSPLLPCAHLCSPALTSAPLHSPLLPCTHLCSPALTSAPLHSPLLFTATFHTTVSPVPTVHAIVSPSQMFTPLFLRPPLFTPRFFPTVHPPFVPSVPSVHPSAIPSLLAMLPALTCYAPSPPPLTHCPKHPARCALVMPSPPDLLNPPSPPLPPQSPPLSPSTLPPQRWLSTHLCSPALTSAPLRSPLLPALTSAPLRSPLLPCAHLCSPALTSAPLRSPLLPCTHLCSPALTSAPLRSPLLPCAHLCSPALTSAPLRSPLLPCAHLCSPALTSAPLHSPLLPCTHLCSPALTSAPLHSPLLTHLCSPALNLCSPALTSAPLRSPLLPCAHLCSPALTSAPLHSPLLPALTSAPLHSPLLPCTHLYCSPTFHTTVSPSPTVHSHCFPVPHCSRHCFPVPKCSHHCFSVPRCSHHGFFPTVPHLLFPLFPLFTPLPSPLLAMLPALTCYAPSPHSLIAQNSQPGTVAAAQVLLLPPRYCCCHPDTVAAIQTLFAAAQTLLVPPRHYWCRPDTVALPPRHCCCRPITVAAAQTLLLPPRHCAAAQTLLLPAQTLLLPRPVSVAATRLLLLPPGCGSVRWSTWSGGELQRFAIGVVWEREVEHLSGGELQRFAIGVVAGQLGDIYMFDEPSSYLDVRQRLKAAQVIRSLLRPDRYVIVVERDLSVLDYLSHFMCCLYGKPGAYRAVFLRYHPMHPLPCPLTPHSIIPSPPRYVIVVEHDLSVLDYLSDFICCLYGKPGAYGWSRCPSPHTFRIQSAVRGGINIFLAGFVLTENLRFPRRAAHLQVDNPEEAKTYTRYKYPRMVKKQGGFKLTGNLLARLLALSSPCPFHDPSSIPPLSLPGGSLRPDPDEETGKEAQGFPEFNASLDPDEETGKEAEDLPEFNVSYKPQKISPKFPHSVRALLHSKIRDSFHHPAVQHRRAAPHADRPAPGQEVVNLSGGELQRVAITLCLGKVRKEWVGWSTLSWTAAVQGGFGGGSGAAQKLPHADRPLLDQEVVKISGGELQRVGHHAVPWQGKEGCIKSLLGF